MSDLQCIIGIFLCIIAMICFGSVLIMGIVYGPPKPFILPPPPFPMGPLLKDEMIEIMIDSYKLHSMECDSCSRGDLKCVDCKEQTYNVCKREAEKLITKEDGE